MEEPWMLTLATSRLCPYTSSIYRCIVRVPRRYRLSVTLHLPAIFRSFHNIRSDAERRSRASRDHNLLSVAGFWSVNVTFCQYRVMYNSVQILFRLKYKTYFNWDLITTDTEDYCFRTCTSIACNVVDRDTHVTNFPDLQHTNVCERNYIRYYGYFLQSFFLNIWIFNL